MGSADLRDIVELMVAAGLGVMAGLIVGWVTWRRGWVADRRRTEVELAELRADRARLRRRLPATDEAEPH